jgi:DNA polymerase-3 subunit delta
MLYLYFGEDDFTSRDLAAAARTRHADVALGDLATRVLDGTTCSWDDVVQACSTLPFLAACQVVEVRGLLGAASAERKGGGAARGEPRGDASKGRVPPPAGFAAFVAGLPETTVLILLEGALNATNPYVKALHEARLDGSTIQQNMPLPPAAVARWLHERAAAAGVTLERDAVGLLIAAHRADLWALSAEIAKLAAYAGRGGTVTPAMVQALVATAAEATVFALTDAIAQGRLGAALPLLHALLAGGAAPEYVMAVLSGRLRDWLLGTGRGPRPAGQTQASLTDAFTALVHADRVLKTGSSDDRLVVMDLLVAILTERLPSSILEEAFSATP